MVFKVVDNCFDIEPKICLSCSWFKGLFSDALHSHLTFFWGGNMCWVTGDLKKQTEEIVL